MQDDETQPEGETAGQADADDRPDRQLEEDEESPTSDPAPASDQPADPQESPGDGDDPEDPEETSDVDPARDERESLRSDLRALRDILERTGRRDRLAAVAEGAIWYVAAAVGVVISALAVGLVAPRTTPWLSGWILLAGTGGVGLAGIGHLVGYLRRAGGIRSTARRLQRADRSFRNDLVAALEFGDTLGNLSGRSPRELGFSPRLAGAHVRRTLRAVRERLGESRHLADLLPDRHFAPPLVAAMAGLALLGTALGIAPARTEATLAWPQPPGDHDARADQLVRPIVGDIRLTYSPPRYTDRGEETTRPSTGRIETIAGTEVTLTTYPLMEVADVELVIENADGDRRVPMRHTGSGRLRKTLVLTASGSYHFEATLPDGTEVRSSDERRIVLQKDQPPGVAITSHEGTVEVSPDDTLTVTFRVEDDFGIDAVEYLHHFAGDKENRTIEPIEIGSLSDSPRELEHEFEFPLKPLDLKPKDVVVFRLQATDNNSRTGPGIGKSDALRLKVASPEAKHLELVRRQRAFGKKLLSLLGDYLENPVGERIPQEDGSYAQEVSADTAPTDLADRIAALQSIHRRESSLLDEMETIRNRMAEDPLMQDQHLSIFEGLHEQLKSLHDRGDRLLGQLSDADDSIPDEVSPRRAQRAADFTADMESNLEQMVLRIMELVGSQKMDAVQSTRKDVEELQNRLKRLLEKYKKTNDPELKKEIKRKINRLKQRMSELMQRMQMQIRELPKSHLNEEALKKEQLQSKTRKASSSLDKLEKNFEKGNIDGALKALEQMSSKMSSVGKKMEKQFSSAQPRGLSELDKKMSKMMDKVNDLKSAERELEKKTDELQKERQKKRKKRVRKMLDKLTNELQKKVKRQREALDRTARDTPEALRSSNLREARKSLDKLDKRLENNDVEQSLEAAQKSLEKLRTMRFNMNLAQRRARRGSSKRATLKQNLGRLDEMTDRGKKIERKLQRTMKQAKRKLRQSGSDKRMKRLAKKQRRIDKQAEKLKKRIQKASKKFPMLKQKLSPKLGKARKQMKRARKRLSGGKPQGALDSERSALEKLGKLKKSMRRAMRKKRQKRSGRSGMRKDDVDIPEREEGASEEDLRRDVMKRMKDDKVGEYSKEIKRYYKSLVE